MANPPPSSGGLLPAPPLNGDPLWIQWAQDLTDYMGQFLVTLNAPGLVTGLTGTASPTAIVLQWNATNGASSYRLFRNSTGDFASATVIQTIGASKTGIAVLTAQDTLDTASATRYYWVQGVNERGVVGPQSQMFSIMRSPPAATVVTETVAIAVATFTDSTALIPPGATVLSVSALVTATIPVSTPTQLHVTNNLISGFEWGSGPVTAGTALPGDSSGAILFPSAAKVRFSFEGITPDSNTGQVFITVTYTT